MITPKTALAAAALIAAAATPQIASASTACRATKAHVVHRTLHHRPYRPTAVAAYREGEPAPETRTIVETRYIPEPVPERVVVEAAPDDYGGYAPYPVYYHHYGYGPYYRHVVYGGPVVVIGHRHW